jgi:hypothetical protein
MYVFRSEGNSACISFESERCCQLKNEESNFKFHYFFFSFNSLCSIFCNSPCVCFRILIYACELFNILYSNPFSKSGQIIILQPIFGLVKYWRKTGSRILLYEPSSFARSYEIQHNLYPN